MDRDILRNRFIIVSKFLMGAIVVMLLGLILMSGNAESEEINIPEPFGIIMTIVFVMTVVVYIVMFLLEMKLSIKESGTIIIGSLALQIGVVFGILYILETFLFHENEPLQYYFGFAVALVMTNKSIDYWKRYDKSKRKTYKTEK